MSPPAEKHQSSAERTLSISRSRPVRSSAETLALDPDADREKRSRKYVACRRAASRFALPCELLERVGSDRLQQIPTRSRIPVQHDQRLGDEVGEALHDGGRVDGAIVHHRGGRIEGEAAGEYGQVTQQTLLCLGQKLIAPIEHRPQGPMPRQRRAASTCQQREAIVQAGGHLLYAKRGGVRRREFDCQRYAIEMPADRANARELVGTRREARVQRLGSGDEQLDRAVTQNVVRFVPPGSGNVQRRNAIDMLTVRSEGFAARRDDRGMRAVRQERFGQRSPLRR